MPLSISSPKVTIKNRIKTDWDASNVLGITPAFHTGFLNPGGDQYQVCFPNMSEATAEPSGYRAIASDGPVSYREGTLPCMIFGRRLPVRSENEINPKKFVELAAREVERIVHAAFVSLPDFEYISIGSSVEQPPDTEYEPPFFGWTAMILYTWRKTLS